MSLIGRVGTKLNSLLMEETPAAGGGPRSAAALAGRESASLHLERDDFESHLREMLRRSPGSQPLAGRINFIGLTKIREKLGDRWPQIARLADDVTRKAIERRLTNVDVYTRYKEHHYLIIFAQLSKEQAQLKCALIAEEITKRLLGEDITPDLLEVKTMVSPVGGEIGFEDVPSIEVLAVKLSGSEDATDSGKTAANSGAADGDDTWWEDGNSAGADPLAGIQLVYRPMWDVKRNAVTTYLCVPARPGPVGRLLVGESELPTLDVAAVHRLDSLVQRRVISDLRKLVAANQRMLLCLPVHFETLASHARRAEYIALCQRGIPPQGVKQLAFEVTGVPAGIAPSRLLDFSVALRRFGRGLLMRTTVDQIQFRPPNEWGVAGVGFESTLGGTPESRQIQDMERFAAAAKKAGLVAYVHGLRSISLTTAAVGAGFDFVAGDIVKSVVERPSSAYSFEMSDLFGRANDA
jgi:hypothetical protein